MNRTIKFRVWDIINKKMLEYKDIMDLPMWEVFPGTPEQRAFNVMQYTGLKDKNGKEIYEGDVLSGGEEYYQYYGNPVVKIGNYKDEKELYDEENDLFEILTTGVYFEFENGSTTGIDYECISEFEVIGNIYENPKLLEEKQ